MHRGSRDCIEHTNGEFNTCHVVLVKEKCDHQRICEHEHGVCIPDKLLCKSNQDCIQFGTKTNGLLRAYCQNDVCIYGNKLEYFSWLH